MNKIALFSLVAIFVTATALVVNETPAFAKRTHKVTRAAKKKHRTAKKPTTNKPATTTAAPTNNAPATTTPNTTAPIQSAAPTK